jgi:hypothetical protein
MDIIALARDLSILLAAWTAIYGIDSWRREFRGKRDIELAEDILVLFYEARDAITTLRSPFGYEGEGSSRKAAPHERPDQKDARDRASVVFERYEKYSDLFSRLYASRYRFMARFGREHARPFHEIRKAVSTIFTSARMLSELWVERSWFPSPERAQRYEEQRQRHEAIFWHMGEESDEVSAQVEAAVADIEKTCKAVIEGRSSLHAILNRPLLGRRYGLRSAKEHDS